jgi:hypothetical protein
VLDVSASRLDRTQTTQRLKKLVDVVRRRGRRRENHVSGQKP